MPVRSVLGKHRPVWCDRVPGLSRGNSNTGRVYAAEGSHSKRSRVCQLKPMIIPVLVAEPIACITDENGYHEAWFRTMVRIRSSNSGSHQPLILPTPVIQAPRPKAMAAEAFSTASPRFHREEVWLRFQDINRNPRSVPKSYTILNS